VYLREPESDTNFRITSTDRSGRFIFENLPAGSFELFSATYKYYYDLNDRTPPDETVTVLDRQTVALQDITVPREISRIEINGLDVTHNGSNYETVEKNHTIPRAPVTLSWENISGANSYSVTLIAAPDDTPPGPTGYEQTVETRESSVMWSALAPGSYHIYLDALDDRDNLVGRGFEWFIVSTETR